MTNLRGVYGEGYGVFRFIEDLLLKKEADVRPDQA
jgi:hypothetical protein